MNFQSGQSSTTVTVPIRNDDVIEPDENFFGRLRSTGVGDVSITQDRAEVIIVNDDGSYNAWCSICSHSQYLSPQRSQQ